MDNLPPPAWSPIGPEHPAYRYLLARQESPHLAELTLGLLHKINNVFTGIMFLVAECLNREEAGEPVSEQLREIQATLQETHGYINRIHQLHADEPNEDAVYCELDADIAGHLDLARLLLPRGTALTHSPSDERLTFYASRRAFSQILLHVIGNCGEALPKRGGEVVITSRIHDENPDLVAVEIRDNGPGFAAETLDGLFTPFCTTKDDTRHVGLGLLHCRVLARKYGGDLTVGNHPTGGAVVILTLPRDSSPISE